MTPWVMRLLITNVVAFVLTQRFPATVLLFGFRPDQLMTQPWTIVTYMFLHADLWHLLFNMLALYFFGPMLELRLGNRRFLGLYLISGLTGALFSFTTPLARVIGASGAVYGVMYGFARYWPRVQVLIWGILPVQAWVLVIIMTMLALYGGAGFGQPGVAHFAHLGGFAGGALYLFFLERYSPASRFRARAQPTTQPVDTDAVDRWKRINREAMHPVNREEFDRLMRKIASNGVSALSDDERLFLERFTPAA